MKKCYRSFQISGGLLDNYLVKARLWMDVHGSDQTRFEASLRCSGVLVLELVLCMIRANGVQ